MASCKTEERAAFGGAVVAAAAATGGDAEELERVDDRVVDPFVEADGRAVEQRVAGGDGEAVGPLGVMQDRVGELAEEWRNSGIESNFWK